MPVLSRFRGVVVRMWHDDHPPPHIHASYQGFEAQIRISDGQVINGKLPPKIAKMLRKWCLSRRSALLENWRKACRFESLHEIEGPEHD